MTKIEQICNIFAGFQPHFPLRSEGRRISHLKYRQAWTNNSENNKIIKLIPTKMYDVIVPSYSADQQQPDSNGEPNKLLVALVEYCRPYTMIGTVSSNVRTSILYVFVRKATRNEPFYVITLYFLSK